MSDFQEPWLIKELDSGLEIFNRDGTKLEITEDVYHRIVTCVNACQGMEAPEITIDSMQYCQNELLKQIKGER